MANHAEEGILSTESTSERLADVNNSNSTASSWNQVFYLIFLTINIYSLCYSFLYRQDTNLTLHRSTASASLFILLVSGSDRRLMSWWPA